MVEVACMPERIRKADKRAKASSIFMGGKKAVIFL
jgi:hypothetical protein